MRIFAKVRNKKLIFFFSWYLVKKREIFFLFWIKHNEIGILTIFVSQSSFQLEELDHYWINCPVNMHTLFLFWKHGSVCDPVKKVQNMGCKKQGTKNRVIVMQKEKRPGCFFSFWITMTLFFYILLFAKSRVPDILKVPDPKNIKMFAQFCFHSTESHAKTWFVC